MSIYREDGNELVSKLALRKLVDIRSRLDYTFDRRIKEWRVT